MKLMFTLVASGILMLLSGCESSQTKEEIFNVAADNISVTGLTGDSVKLVKTASINFKVKDVYKGSRNVSELARSKQGMITHQNIESRQEQTKELPLSNDSLLLLSVYNTYAHITARIPSDQLEDFLYQVSELGYFTQNSTLNVDDKSLEYLANHLKQQNRLGFLSQAGSKNIKGQSSFGLVDKKDEAIDNEMQKRQINADARYSTVQLSLYQNPVVQREVIVNSKLDTYNLPLSRNFENAFQKGWQMFLTLLLALAHLWVFIAAGFIVWLIIRFYQNRKNPYLIQRS